MIKGVAVRVGKIMFCLPNPNRHCDCFNLARQTVDFDKIHRINNPDNQGFYNEKGLFLTRLQAMSEAQENDQLLNDENKSIYLFSEDVW